MAALEDLRRLVYTAEWKRGPVTFVMKSGNLHVVASAHMPRLDLFPGTGLIEVKLLITLEDGLIKETDGWIDYSEIEVVYTHWW